MPAQLLIRTRNARDPARFRSPKLNDASRKFSDLARNSKSMNIYIYIRVENISFDDRICDSWSISYSRLKEGCESRINRFLNLYIYRKSGDSSFLLQHNSVGEISSATVKEPVDRVIFDRVPPRIHVDSIMQKYDNLPTRSGPGQINALSGPDPNAGSPLQLEDHNIFLRGIGVSTSLSPVLNLLCNCPSYRAIPLVSSVKAIVLNLSREKWFSVIHGIIV